MKNLYDLLPDFNFDSDDNELFQDTSRSAEVD